MLLRPDVPVPLHRQIETSIREGIRAGRLPRGSSLPPTRVLAADLGVSRGVVVEAYQQLAAEGYLTSRAGGYTQVAAGPAAPAAAPRPVGEPKPAIDLSYGRADVSSFPRAAWLRAIRGALTDAPNEVFGYLTGRGVPQLRTSLAEYLNRVRGTVAEPDHMVICTGYAQGVTLLTGVLAAAGAKRLALEDPSSNDDALPAARAAGLEASGSRSTARASGSTCCGAAEPMPSSSRPRTSGPPGRSCRPGTGPRSSAGPPSAGRSSSRTTTTPSIATTGHLSARCRAWLPGTSPTPARRARRSRPGCGSGGSCCPAT